MNGSTLCPHCQTRFKITDAQLNAHQGRVRCGHCLLAFDAIPGFIVEITADEISASADTHAEFPPETVEPTAHPVENGGIDESLPDASSYEPPDAQDPVKSSETDVESADITVSHEADQTDIVRLDTPKTKSTDSLDFNQITESHRTAEQDAAPVDDSQGMTLAEQICKIENSEDGEDEEDTAQKKSSRWPWVTGISVLVILLAAQSAYFFRTDLSSHLPAAKPALVGFCHLTGCTVPLPQKTDQVIIESSSLDADPAIEGSITFNALLRNRESYPLAFPMLALSLNDSQDSPLARRIFLPSEYLPSTENEQTGFPQNHEVNIKLPLHIANLKPVGYRLELFYKPD